MLVNFKQSVHEPQLELSGAFTIASSTKKRGPFRKLRDQRRVLIFTIPSRPLNRQHPVKTFLSLVDGVVNEMKSNWKRNRKKKKWNWNSYSVIWPWLEGAVFKILAWPLFLTLLFSGLLNSVCWVPIVVNRWPIHLYILHNNRWGTLVYGHKQWNLHSTLSGC